MTPRKRAAVVAILVVAVIAVAGVVTWQVKDRPQWQEPQATGETVKGPVGRFYEQDLTWSDCGTGHCTRVTVPIDYAKPKGKTLELGIRVFPAGKGTAQRSIFVNPGGPGGSAIDYAASMSRQFGSSVTNMYDIVGVDPRGVGTSTPLTCLSDSAFDTFTETDPDPDDPAEVAALRQSLTDLGQACQQKSGALAAHVSTEEAARDMDVVRALLGRTAFDWFGASYGTQLGATYATLFPDRVGRMVLDGAVDPMQDSIEASFGQTTGFQRAFDAYAASCIDKGSCPLGTSVADARRSASDLLSRLDAQPLKTNDDRVLTEGQAFYGLALPLYNEESWPVLTQALTQALQSSDGTTLLALSDAYFSRQANGTYTDNTGQVIYAINCLDSADAPDLKAVRQALPRFEEASPVFGRALGWGALGCTDWPIKPTSPQGPVSAKGAAPIVVIGTTRDPATPYESAVKLAEELSSGVLLTREGDGHTAYNSGNSCITKAVDTYLVKGTVPKDGTTCAE